MNEAAARYMVLSADELKAQSKVPLTIVEDVDSANQHFARSIADEIKANNAQGQVTRFILPVGPVLQYPILLDIMHQEGISWKNVWPPCRRPPHC